MQDLIARLFAATNAFDVKTALRMFARGAVLKDKSVGETFQGQDGVRRYLEDYFVAYRTATRVLSIDLTDDRHATVRVDFTGAFGHEIGILNVGVDEAGRIASIETHLE